MPYTTNRDLPPSVRMHLPSHAQDIFRAAFNNAFQDFADNPDQEQIAFRVAWAAVKRSYEKKGEEWIAKARRAAR